LDRVHTALSSIGFVSPRRLYVSRLGRFISKLRTTYGLPRVSVSDSSFIPATTSAFSANLNPNYSVGSSSSSSYAVAGPSVGGKNHRVPKIYKSHSHQYHHAFHTFTSCAF
jgi:hypothetical protein